MALQKYPVPDSRAWLPPDEEGVRARPCGRWFDAVRVARFDGVLAISRLQERSGPVIEDQGAGVLCWLVPVAAADGWELPGVEVLGMGCSLAVPPARWTQGPAVRWLIAPGVGGDCLTNPSSLRDALARAADARRHVAPNDIEQRVSSNPHHYPPLTEPIRRQVRCLRCRAWLFEGDAHHCPVLRPRTETAR
jgi:hypothetical protein